jgi:hypothetical protein
MRDVKVRIVIKSIYRSAWQQLRDKLQANTGERKRINEEVVSAKKKKDEEKYKKNIITKNYITQSFKYY